MEFVNGHSLGYYLKHRHVFSEADGLQIVRQVGRALAVAHAEGLVHRDIKPDNVMLTNRGEVKIVDLGIAKRVDEDTSLTQSGTSIGTPHYISPEQIRGQKDIDARADVYSLGATFYHLVTGHTPFQRLVRAARHVDAPRRPAPRPADVGRDALGGALPDPPEDDGEEPRGALRRRVLPRRRSLSPPVGREP